MSRAATMINRLTADSAVRNMPKHEPIERLRQPLDRTTFGESNLGEQPHYDSQQRHPVAFDGKIPVHPSA